MSVDQEVYEEAVSTVEAINSGELTESERHSNRTYFEIDGEKVWNSTHAKSLYMEKLLSRYPGETESVVAGFRDRMTREDGVSSLASLGEVDPFTTMVNRLLDRETRETLETPEGEEYKISARGVSREYSEKFWEEFKENYGDCLEVEALEAAVDSYEGIQWGEGAGAKDQTAPLLEYAVEETGNKAGTEFLDWWTDDYTSTQGEREAVRVFARENQDTVRRVLQPRNDEIRLYRGVKYDEVDSTSEIPENPVEHWTASPVAAQFFGEDGQVLAADVPVDDVIAWSGATPQRPQQASEFVVKRRNQGEKTVIPESQFDELQHTFKVIENVSSLREPFRNTLKDTTI
ncbi:MAG: hypothetical protein ABEK10_03570 [Candidatus Nanosalina sp.]